MRATDDQEEVARQFERYDLVAAPVVDEGDRLVGVMTVDDIVDVIEEEAEEDIKALGGVAKHEELSDSVWTIAKGRFPWLLANLVTALLASSVIAMFESSIQKMVALAVLMPIVASMGGNAGTQTMTVAVRALATRDLSDANSLRFARREFLVGLINGLGFAVIMGAVASFWFQTVRSRSGHRARHDLRPGGGCARRLRHPGHSRKARHRSGGVVGSLRHHGDGHHRIFLLSGDRDALVRLEIVPSLLR